MKLLTKAQRERLEKNAQQEGVDHQPVVKFFNPCGAATWLFTELHDGDLLYGLCDLGMGFPEIGYASLQELAEINVGFGLGIERDRHFKANKTLSAYAEEAYRAQRIVA